MARRIPVRLRQAVDLHGGAAALEQAKLGSVEGEGEAVAACFHERLLQAPQLPERILLSRWTSRAGVSGGAAAKLHCAALSTFRPGRQHVRHLGGRELLLEQLHVLTHRRRLLRAVPS
jgi:hypothetical protein